MKEKSGPGKGAVFKALVLAVFIVAAVYIVRITAVKDFLTVERMRQLLDTSGFYAPLIFIIIYTVGICLFVPGTLLTTLGAAIFGAYRGFLYVLIAAVIGATAAFFIGRYPGVQLRCLDHRRPVAALRRGHRAQRLRRLGVFAPDPFSLHGHELRHGPDPGPVSGLFLGHGPGHHRRNLHHYFFLGTIKEVWAGGDWPKLRPFQVVFSVALFAFSLFFPKIMKKLK
jgi:hypothetical protein